MPEVVPLVWGLGGAPLCGTSKLDRRSDLRLREDVVGDVGWEASIVALRDEEDVGEGEKGRCREHKSASLSSKAGG